uniref:Uncharacterized protein n=1 Tax=Romanomermis culicivorax TaxID=13658 RepID=A0A915IEV5_ROMCU
MKNSVKKIDKLMNLIYRANVRQYALNFTINTASHNLQERFTNWSNIKAMSDLLPFLIYQTSLAASVNLCSIILLVTNWSRTLDQKTMCILMFMNLTRTGNFFLSPLIWMLKNEKTRAKLLEFEIFSFLCRFTNMPTKVQICSQKNETFNQKIQASHHCNVVPFRMGPNVSNDVLNSVWAVKKMHVKKKR